MVLAQFLVHPNHAAAQSYFATEYDEVEGLVEPMVSRVGEPYIQLWLTLHAARSGYVFRLPRDASESGFWGYWSSHESEAGDCPNQIVGSGVYVCPQTWPPAVSPSALIVELGMTGLFPLPDRAALSPRRSVCPDDGWHLWIVESGGGNLEHCVRSYEWPDESVALAAIAELESFIRDHSLVH